jgi:PAS domain S-box-containing protein
MRLSTKLPLITLLAVLVPVVFVFYFGFFYAHDELHKSNESKLEAIAKIRTQQINERLDGYELKLVTLAYKSELKDILAEKNNLDLKELDLVTNSLLNAMPDIERVVIFDKNGKFLIATDKIEHKLNSSAYTFLPKDKKDAVYTYIFEDKKPKIGMIKAIYTDDGVLVGYLAYMFGYEWLNKIGTDYTGLGRTGETVIAGWGADNKPYYLSSRRHSVHVELGVVDITKTKLAMVNALNGIEGFSHDYEDYRGVPVIAATSYLPKYRIAIAIKMDIEEAHEGLKRFFLFSVSALSLSLVIVIFIVWFILNRLGRRIESYSDVAKKISAGDLWLRLYDEHSDELVELGVAFNELTTKLVNANTELEKLLIERTQRLEATEEMFQNTFETASVGLAHVSLEGKFLRINDAFCSIVGYTRDEMLSIDFGSITHPDDIDADMANVRELLSGVKSTYMIQKRYFHKNGSIVWVLLNVSMALDSEKKPKYFISAVQDITQIKELEATNNNLLTHLKTSNTDLQQFAYIASHDLQEPLRMVSSYIQLIEKRYNDTLDSEGKEFMAFAVDGAKRMQGLINGLLEFSRVNTRGGKFAQIDMSEVLETVKQDLKLSIAESGAIITSDALPKIVADENQMAQLLRNLVVNAIKYHADKQPNVHIGFVDDESKWHFYIKDNGLGIKKEYFEKIFLIFQRLHSREAYPGTGLGLTICKRIADRHDGNVWVESEFGQGSVFHFTISKKLQGEHDGK